MSFISMQFSHFNMTWCYQTGYKELLEVLTEELSVAPTESSAIFIGKSVFKVFEKLLKCRLKIYLTSNPNS